MDDDFFALKWNAALIMRDPRTTLSIEADSPRALLTALRTTKKIDVFLIDTEYHPPSPPLPDLIDEINALITNPIIICLSEYVDEALISNAFKLNIKGYLIKNEIKMAIVPALVKASMRKKVITPSVSAFIREHSKSNLDEYEIIPVWKPNPKLKPTLLKCFWLRVFFGMHSVMVAKELGVEMSTVDKYMNLAYKILPSEWANSTYLNDFNLDELSAEDQAFIWFTLPPNI